MATYGVNQGPRDKAIRMGCEAGLYEFVMDYAEDMGLSASGALRRFVLLGAQCEAEHGKARMPASYKRLFYDPKQTVEEMHSTLDQLSKTEDDEEFDWGEGNVDKPSEV